MTQSEQKTKKRRKKEGEKEEREEPEELRETRSEMFELLEEAVRGKKKLEGVRKRRKNKRLWGHTALFSILGAVTLKGER